MKPTTRLRQLLKEKDIIVAPGCFDPMSARIVEYLGFDVAYMGGQSTGQHLVIGEPQVTLTEQVEEAHKATRVIDIPLIVDAGAGFGEPVHVIRCIREFEDAGIAGVHIEDQLYPKRMSYHILPKGLKHMHSAEDFLLKLQAALEARRDKDFVIIARTDARDAVGGSLKEAIRRSNLYAEAGADVILPLLHDIKEMEQFRKEVPNVPLLHVHGTAVNYYDAANLSVDQLRDMGWNIVIYNSAAPYAAAKGILDIYTSLKQTGRLNAPWVKDIANIVQNDIQKMKEYWDFEAKTVEKETKKA